MGHGGCGYTDRVGGSIGDLDYLELIDRRSYKSHIDQPPVHWRLILVWARDYYIEYHDHTALRAIPV